MGGHISEVYRCICGCSLVAAALACTQVEDRDVVDRAWVVVAKLTCNVSSFTVGGGKVRASESQVSISQRSSGTVKLVSANKCKDIS